VNQIATLEEVVELVIVETHDWLTKEKHAGTTKYKKHRADRGFREFRVLNEHPALMTRKFSESPTFFIQTVMCDEKQKNMTVEMNKRQIIKGLNPAPIVAEVVLPTRKANPHHHSHRSANPAVMFQEIQSSYLYGKFHPFPLELIRRISSKRHGRTSPRLETDWGCINILNYTIMDNLSFEELKALAESVAENTLLERISGGTANDCHDEPPVCPDGTCSAPE